MKKIPIIYKNCAKIRQNISIPKSERHLLTNNSMPQQTEQPLAKTNRAAL